MPPCVLLLHATLPAALITACNKHTSTSVICSSCSSGMSNTCSTEQYPVQHDRDRSSPRLTITMYLSTDSMT